MPNSTKSYIRTPSQSTYTYSSRNKSGLQDQQDLAGFTELKKLFNIQQKPYPILI